jgi:hypothetical protein
MSGMSLAMAADENAGIAVSRSSRVSVKRRSSSGVAYFFSGSSSRIVIRFEMSMTSSAR